MSSHWTIRAVDELPYDDGAALERIVAGSRPVMFRRLVKDWPAIELWSSLDYVESQVGTVPIPVSFFPNREFEDVERIRTELPFGEIRERVLDPGKNEASKVNLQLQAHARPGVGKLLDDISMPKALPETVYPRLFFGKNFVTQIHYHFGTEAMLCNVVGTKRVFLFRPTDFARLYPYRWNRNRFALARLHFKFDNSNFDVFRYPRAKNLEVIEAVVEPGDALFIPVYWPHLTFSYGVSFAVTLFWDAAWRQLLSSWLLLRRNHLRRADTP